MENREKMKSILLELLDQFVQVCESNGLQYYLAAGSVLGAVRHKGIIPWDDDIDVYLSREDYEKIQLLPQSVWGKSMRLATWRNTKKYRYHFLKVESTTTTLIEQFDPIYVGGVYLDIFPLDSIPDDIELAQKQAADIRKCFDKYYILNATNPQKCPSFYHYLKYRIKHCLYTIQHIQNKWENVASRYTNSEKIADFHSEGYENPMYSKWFGQGKMMEFEGKMYKVPSDTDAYLRFMYGDYMTPPPLKDRIGHDSYLYVNFDRRISGAELKKVLSLVEEATAYQFDCKKEWVYIKHKLHL